jgi:hypothetical protein
MHLGDGPFIGEEVRNISLVFPLMNLQPHQDGIQGEAFCSRACRLRAGYATKHHESDHQPSEREAHPRASINFGNHHLRRLDGPATICVVLTVRICDCFAGQAAVVFRSKPD